MYERWTKDEENLLFSLYDKLSLNELSNIIGKSKEQIKAKGYRHNLTFMNVWSCEEDDYLKQNYKNMTYKEIAINLGRTKSAIQSRCRKLGLIKSYSSSKNKLNSDYFELIDTEEKAYWLGFICADGCVSYNKSTKSYSFKITLQRSDENHLKHFIRAINGDFDVKRKQAFVYFNGINRSFDTCEVSFRDKKFTSDLLQYFSTNKTDYLRIPKQIPKDMIRHFIRGFADGDGCFYCNIEKRNKSFEIVGKCYEMMLDIQNELRKNNIDSSIYRKRETNYKLGIYRIEELIKLQSYLYDGATIFMNRKYKKSQEILKLAS